MNLINSRALTLKIALVLATTTPLARGAPAPKNIVAKACIGQKKTHALCNCIQRSVDSKLRKKDYSEEQIAMLVQALQQRKPSEEKALEYDTMADYLAGLEFHCKENPKYSED